MTVLQASYTLLKIKVDYTIHDTAFDCMLKAMSALLPEGHFLPMCVGTLLVLFLQCKLYACSTWLLSIHYQLQVCS